MKTFMIIFSFVAVFVVMAISSLELEYANTRQLIHQDNFTCECLPADINDFRANPDSVYRKSAESFYKRGRFVKVGKNYLVSKNY